MKVVFKIKCRLPWFKYAKRKIDFLGSTFEEINQERLRYDEEFCPDIVFNNGKDKFRVNNLGKVEIEYGERLTNEQIRTHIHILISFISMCIGDICQCQDWIIIDNQIYETFFDFPSETPLEIPLYQKRKFWEVSFEEIRNDFGSILDFLLYSPKSKIITTYILPNYLATVYIIDFIGNREWKFKNAVTTIESLMYYIKSEDYTNTEKDNKQKFKNLKSTLKKIEKLKDLERLNDVEELKELEPLEALKELEVLTEFETLKPVSDYLSPKRVNLDKKICDAILLGQEYLGVDIKEEVDINIYSKKCANTRNLLSHYIEENPNNQYLAENEISDATDFLITLSKYFLLKEICQNIDITRKFKSNLLMRTYLHIYTNWNCRK